MPYACPICDTSIVDAKGGDYAECLGCRCYLCKEAMRMTSKALAGSFIFVKG